MNEEFCGGEELITEDFDLCGLSAFLPGCGGRFPARTIESERGFFGVGDEALRVHGVEIFAAEVAEVAGLFGAGADFGEGDVFEDGFESVEKIKILAARGVD